MIEDNFLKEPYDVILAKLKLAELTIELGNITRKKWERYGTMKDILLREEELITQIANSTEKLQDIIDKK